MEGTIIFGVIIIQLLYLNFDLRAREPTTGVYFSEEGIAMSRDRSLPWVWFGDHKNHCLSRETYDI